MSDGFVEFVARLEREDIASPSDLQGCSFSEIEVLESKYQLTLPHSYRRFLELMGHASRRLFRYDHFATSYEYVLTMTEQERQYAAEDGEDDKLSDVLAASSLIILGRLGEQFMFIHCHDHDDSAVYYYNNSTWETRQVFGSVLEYLNCIADECADAVRGGYFQNSEGTCP